MKKKLFLLPVMAIVLALMFIFTACGDSDSKKDKDDEDSTPKYERPVEAYFKAIETGSGKELKKCFCEAEIEKRNESAESGEDYFENGAKELYQSCTDKFGDNVRITYKIKNKEKLEEDDLNNFSDRLTRRCGGDDEIKVTEGYKFELNVKVKGDKGEDENTMNMKVGKTDGKWIILDIY